MSNLKILVYNVYMKNYHQAFIENLKTIRKSRQISQALLAEKCNVSNGTIGNIECGITKPSFDLIFQMAEALEIPVSELFKTNENSTKQNITIEQKNKIKKTISSKIEKTLKEILTSVDSI